MAPGREIARVQRSSRYSRAPVVPKAFAILALAALLVLVADAPSARAHRGSATYLVVEPTDDGANVTAQVEIVDAAVELQLGESASEEAVLAEPALIRVWLTSQITLTSDGRPCTATAGEITRADSEDAPRLSVDLTFVCA